jgi:hypothetical protein
MWSKRLIAPNEAGSFIRDREQCTEVQFKGSELTIIPMQSNFLRHYKESHNISLQESS